MVAAEVKALRESVGIMDVAASTKVLVERPDVYDLLDRPATNWMPQNLGSITLIHMLNRTGRIELETTAVRITDDQFYLVCAVASWAQGAGYFGRLHRQGVSGTLKTDLPWVCAYLAIQPDGTTNGHRGEAVMLAGSVVGSTTLVAYGPPVRKILAFADIKPDAAVPDTTLEVLIHGTQRRARVLGEPAYDHQSLKPKADA